MPTIESDDDDKELELIVEDGVDIDLPDGEVTADEVLDALAEADGSAVLDPRHMVGAHPAYRIVDGQPRCAVIKPERRDDGGVTMVHEMMEVEEDELREILEPAALPVYIQPFEESIFTDEVADDHPWDYS